MSLHCHVPHTHVYMEPVPTLQMVCPIHAYVRRAMTGTHVTELSPPVMKPPVSMVTVLLSEKTHRVFVRKDTKVI